MVATSSPTRRLTVEVPAELYTWLHDAAEISHRTPDAVVAALLEREQARWDAKWDPPVTPPRN